MCLVVDARQGAACWWAHSAGGVAYTHTGQPNMACSIVSKEGFGLDADWLCSALIFSSTCGILGEACVDLNRGPIATISENGLVLSIDGMMRKMCNRGPLPCTLDEGPVLDFTGGIAEASHNIINVKATVLEDIAPATAVGWRLAVFRRWKREHGSVMWRSRSALPLQCSVEHPSVARHQGHRR